MQLIADEVSRLFRTSIINPVQDQTSNKLDLPSFRSILIDTLYLRVDRDRVSAKVQKSFGSS